VSLGAYRDIRLPYEEPTVTEADVEAALKRLQDSRATVEDVERPAQLGDLVNFTVFGTVAPAPQEAAAPEGEAAADESTEAATPEASTETATETTPEASTETDDEPELFIEDEIDEFVLTENAEADVVPGFSAQVIGMSAGEERTFDVTLPEDFQDEEYRNRVVTFKVNLSSVKSRTLPEMNDEFVKTVTDGEHETVEALRTRVQTDLQEDALRTAKSKYADDVLSKVLEGAEIKYPPQMVDQYIHDIIDDLERNLRNRNLSMETYMQISGKTHEDLHHDYEQPAIDRIKRNVVVSEIVKAEQLAITNEEIDAHVEKLTQRFGDSTQASSFRDMLNRDESRRSIAFDLVMERVVDRLAQIGRGEAPELPAPVVAENANMEAAPVAESTNTGTSAEAEVASSETEDAAKE
jgi:FKBP-type peptidyl-prolyl cis-trans isomerase (trigger factor)